MKKAIGGIVIVCVLLLAFVVVRPHLFGEDTEAGNQVAESSVQFIEESEVESVIASAVNPTKEPALSGTAQAGGELGDTPEPTVIPTIKPTAEPTPVPTMEPTAVPTAEPTPTPKVVEIPEATKVPAPAATSAPKQTQEPIGKGVTDEDITYVAELLDVPKEKVQEVVDKAEEVGYELDPDAILNGEVDVIEMWDVVTDVFGPIESAKLLLKVMKLGIG